MREVYFKDCKVGMKFNIDCYSYFAIEVLKLDVSFGSRVEITAEIKAIDEENKCVFCKIHINEKGKPDHGRWIFEEVGDFPISSVLEFMGTSKKKNNYY